MNQTLKNIAHRGGQWLTVLVAVILLSATTSCTQSDPETERRLDGAWTCTMSENEDGIWTYAKSIERYDASTHEYSAEIEFSLGYPVNARIATVSYSGTWKASKEIVEYQIDKESVKFSFNKSLLDRQDREEFRNDMLKELKDEDYTESMRITSEITDTFEAEDDEETYTYHRVY